MKKIVLALLLLSASSYGLTANFQIFNQANKVSLGSCHMDECSYSKSISTQILQKNNTQVILKVKLLGGSSPMIGKTKITWNKKPHELIITCSKTAPSITIGDETTYLPFDPEWGVARVLESDAVLYFKYCHSMHDYLKGIKKYKYNTKNLE